MWLSCFPYRRGRLQRRRSEFTNLFDKVCNHLRKSRAFGRGYPFELEPLGIDPGKLQELFHKSHSLHRHVITVQVMAVSDVSPAYEDAVRTLLKGLEDLMRAYRCRAQSANGPQVWRVLQSADSREICARVRAPVAQEPYYCRFELFIGHIHSPKCRMKKRLNTILPMLAQSVRRSVHWRIHQVSRSPTGTLQRILRIPCTEPCSPDRHPGPRSS